MILTLFYVLLLLLINNLVSSDNNSSQTTLNTPCLDLVIADGNVTVDNNDVNSIRIQCHASYDMIGPDKMQCINGRWMPNFLPQCVSRCHPPAFIWNGGFQIEGEKAENGLYKQGTLVTYSCSPGFYLSPLESKYRVCKDGTWTGDDASCEEPGCKQPQPIKNGYYVRENIDTSGGLGIGERLHYSCSNGYVLTGPSTQKCLSDGSWSPKIQPICTENHKSGVQSAVGARTGYDMSPFIRRYAKYLNEKALSYRAVAFDFCKVKRGKEEGTLRTMTAENLLKTLPILQNQLDALLEFDCTANDLTNGVINMCFMLLFRDLIRLFACYNDGIINLLEKYFEMNKKQCREALDLYKKFLIRMDRVGEFLKVAENIGIDKGDIPDLTKAPNSLLDALEQHLASLEGNTPTAATNQKNLKSGVSVLNNTSNAFGTAANSQIDENVKQAAVAEEEAVLNQYKASIGSPNSASTNPFLSSPTKPAPTSSSNQQILDLFGTEPVASNTVTNQPSKAIDDLLQLGNPFADMFQAPQPPATSTNGNLFDTTTGTTDFFSTPTTTTAAAPPPAATSMWANGFAPQPSFTPQTQPVFPTATNLSGSLFSTNEPSVFDPIAPSTNAQPVVPQQQPVPSAKASQQSQKLLTGDLETSLASLVENLNIDSGKSATTQWNSPKNQPKQATGWQPQPMAVTTGTMYRPMGQPMGGAPMMYPMGVQQQPLMGSPRLGNPQPQQTKQEVSFDPFGDL